MATLTVGTVGMANKVMVEVHQPEKSTFKQKWPVITFHIDVFNHDGVKLDATKSSYTDNTESDIQTFVSNAMQKLDKVVQLTSQEKMHIEATAYGKLRIYDVIQDAIVRMR